MITRRLGTGPVELEIAEAGVGGRPLLLVHGYTGTKENFTAYLDPLAARGWHAVAPDLRGHGASDHPTGEASYSLAIFAADMLGLADTLGWARFTLLGESMGGMVAETLAVEQPDRLEALVLMDTTHGPVRIDPDRLDAARRLVADHGLAALAAELRASRSFDPLATPAYLRLIEQRPEYLEEADRKLLASSADMWLAISREVPSRPDLLASLRNVQVPTLVIAGEQDPLLEDSRRLASAIPGARLAIVPDAGHSPQLENGEAWWHMLIEFLDPLITAGNAK